ncbi:hypothetical protein Btru_056795 [Bulinus truncatus]|nr:hypothetical protein Btru_056795 [Bulinus truncatus]
MIVLSSLLFLSIPFVACEINDEESTAPTLKTLNFAYLTSGIFNNMDQVQEDVSNEDSVQHDGLTIVWKPVDVVTLRPAVIFNGTYYLNGAVLRYGLLAVFQDNTGSIIVKTYLYRRNFTSNEAPNIQLDDVKEQKHCRAKFTMVSRNIFVGTWPECTPDNSQPSKSYTVVITCSGITTSLAPKKKFPESSSDVPYIAYIKRRYPLLDSVVATVDNFQPPCKN